MASLSVTLGKVSCSLKATALKNQANRNFSNAKLMSFGNTFPCLRSSSSLQVCCAAKPETISKVMEIVKTQLALTDEVAATLKPETKFSELGADSLDTVELVMGLEEEYGISVEEDNSQNILTVQDAADVIEKLVSEKAAPASDKAAPASEMK